MEVARSGVCWPVSRQTAPLLPLLPFSNIVLACGYVEGCLEAISQGGISHTDLSLKKPWKGIFPEGHKETAKGNHIRQGPPRFPCTTVLSATPLQVLILSALSFPLLPPSLHPPSLLLQALFPPPRSVFLLWNNLACPWLLVYHTDPICDRTSVANNIFRR